MKTTTHYKGHRWSTEELRKLMQLWAAGASLEDIAAALSSTQRAILCMVQRMRKNGVPLERRRKGHKADQSFQLWTQGDVEYLLRRRTEKATAEEIGLEIGRTPNSVHAMIAKLRTEGVPVAMRGNGVRRLWNADALKSVALIQPENQVIELDQKSA